MTREDIIRMAREAEVLSMYDSETGFCAEAALKFAALVASAERSACIKALEDLDAWNMDDPASSATKVIKSRGQV